MLSLLRYLRSAPCKAGENLISNRSAKIGVQQIQFYSLQFLDEQALKKE